MIIKNKVDIVKNLLYFLAVAKNENIFHTADENGIKPTNLSKMIRTLEKLVDAPLFSRTSKGVTLTPIGLKLVRLAEPLNQALTHLSDIHFLSPIRQTIVVRVPLFFDFSRWHAIYETYPYLSLKVVPDAADFDVGLFYEKPKKRKGFIAGRHLIHTKETTQAIWIISKKDDVACGAVADFIAFQLTS